MITRCGARAMSSAFSATASTTRRRSTPPMSGFSVDTAVDIAKESADMILLGKDLACWRKACSKAGRTFANIIKYIRMGASSNFGNMFCMAGGVLFLPFLPMLPIQILPNNLLYDFSETTIPMDDVSDAMVARRAAGTSTSCASSCSCSDPSVRSSTS